MKVMYEFPLGNKRDRSTKIWGCKRLDQRNYIAESFGRSWASFV